MRINAILIVLPDIFSMLIEKNIQYQIIKAFIGLEQSFLKLEFFAGNLKHWPGQLQIFQVQSRTLCEE